MEEETWIPSPPKASMQDDRPPPRNSPQKRFVEPAFEMPRQMVNSCDAVIDTGEAPAVIRMPISSPCKAHIAEGEQHITPPSWVPSLPVRSASRIQARSHTSSPTLVRSPSDASTATHSPVMRSMFPRYDPRIPLCKQKYYPNIESGLRSTTLPNDSFHRPEYSPSLYSQLGSPSPTFSKANLETPTTAPGSALGSPHEVVEEPAPRLSTPEDLLDMWSIANGQGSQEAADTYVLGLSCNDLTPEQEIISFTSSHQTVYTLQADGSDLIISRTHPVNPTPTISISTPTLFQPDATNPLVAYIFPKLAELMALDQSSSVAASHKLDRTASAELQSEGIKRAKAQEASSLLWDSDSERYYLVHPTLNDGSPVTFHVELETSHASAKPSIIRVLTPLDPASPTQEPLLTFSLSTKALTIHTTEITKHNSLYFLDSLLAAVLVLVLHLQRHNSLLTPTTPSLSLSPTLNFAPPPTLASAPASRTARSKSKPKPKSKSKKLTSISLPRWKSSSKSSATLPRYADDNDDALDKDLAIEETKPKPTSTSQYSTLDLDLSQFQTFDVKDPNLPRGTRMALRVLYWFLGALVWALGLFISVLAAGVVGLGALVKKL